MDRPELERYCARCGYPLRGLAGSRCPECGRYFSLIDPTTFSLSPQPPRVSSPLLVVAVVILIGVGLVAILSNGSGGSSIRQVPEGKTDAALVALANSTNGLILDACPLPTTDILQIITDSDKRIDSDSLYDGWGRLIVLDCISENPYGTACQFRSNGKNAKDERGSGDDISGPAFIICDQLSP